LLSETKEFVETLFEVLDSKTYITTKGETTPTQDEIAPGDPRVLATPDPTLGLDLPDSAATAAEHIVSSTSKSDVLKHDEV